MRKITIPAFLAIATLSAQAAPAADLAISDTSGAVDTIVSVPVVLANATDISLITFQVQPDASLGAPTAVSGPDQTNLLPDDVFVDDLGGGNYRITAFVRSTPNIGNGTTINLEFDLTGLSTGDYPVNVLSAELLTTANLDDTGTLTSGIVTVTSGLAPSEWMLLDQ